MLKIISIFQFFQAFTAAALIGYIWTRGYPIGALFVPTLLLSAFFLLGMLATNYLWKGSRWGIFLSLLFHLVQTPEIQMETFEFSIGLMFGVILTFIQHDSMAIGVNIVSGGIVMALIFCWTKQRDESALCQHARYSLLKQKAKTLTLDYPAVGGHMGAQKDAFIKFYEN